MLFVYGRASPHYKSKKVLKYFEENKDALIPVYLPTASPEFMVMGDIEYCKTRSTCFEILSIIYRF